MKKVLSIFTLIAVFYIGLNHDFIMAFSNDNKKILNYEIIEDNTHIHENKNIKNKKNKEINEDENKDKEEDCIDQCCDSLYIDLLSPKIKKIKEIKYKVTSKTYILSISNKLSNIIFINKIPPPYYKNEIINYSYHTLVKIVKSNT